MKDFGGSDIKLQIENFGADADLSGKIQNYHGLAAGYFSNRTHACNKIHPLEKEPEEGTMTNVPDREAKENPFKKLFDDAKRSLSDSDDLDFIDELPDLSEDDQVSIPFPYGSQPESRKGWKTY